jgi:hypothetical protein
VVNTAMGLGLTRGASISNLMEAILVIIGAVLLPQWFGLQGVFWAGAGAALAMLPSAHSLAAQLGESFWRTWAQPCARFGVSLALAALALSVALYFHLFPALILSVCFVAFLVLWEWRRLHRS